MSRRRQLVRWLKDFRRTLTYYAILPVIAVLSRLPLGLARWLGRVTGAIGWLLARSERLRAMENLRSIFGAVKSPRELRRICRGVFRNVGTNLFELLVIYRWSPERIRREFSFEEEFQAIARAHPAGTVGLTAHLGNWELLGILFGVYLPGRSVVMAKRIYFPKFQGLMEQFRKTVGMEVIYTDESFRLVLKALKAGKIIGLLADQDLKAVNGVFVDFMSKPTYTSTAPANLSLTAGSDILLALLLREGGKYRLIHHVIPLSRVGRREEDLFENTQRWTRILEGDIRDHLDQWMWFHRRWRTRPETGPRRVMRTKRRSGNLE